MIVFVARLNQMENGVNILIMKLVYAVFIAKNVVPNLNSSGVFQKDQILLEHVNLQLILNNAVLILMVSGVLCLLLNVNS